MEPCRHFVLPVDQRSRRVGLKYAFEERWMYSLDQRDSAYEGRNVTSVDLGDGRFAHIVYGQISQRMYFSVPFSMLADAALLTRETRDVLGRLNLSELILL